MNKKKVQYIITGIFFIIFVVLLINTFKSEKKKSSKKEVSAEPLVQNSINEGIQLEKIKADATIVELQKELSKKPWSRDPFYLAKTKKVYQGQAFVLKGISIDKEREPFAFINNEIVSTGDEIEGYYVAEIKKSKILLRKGSDSFYLRMPE